MATCKQSHAPILHWRGYQDDGEGKALDLRTCNACGSTVSVAVVDPREAARDYIESTEPGGVITDDEHQRLGPVAQWIPSECARRNWYLEREPGAWRVKKIERWM